MEYIDQVIGNSAQPRDPVFVVGSPRSGTTVLARAIAQAPEVCYFEESGLIGEVYPSLLSWRQLLQAPRHREPRGRMCLSRLRRIRNRYLRGADQLSCVVREMLRHTRLPEYDLTPTIGLVNHFDIRLTDTEQQWAARLDQKYHQLARRDPHQVVGVILEDFRLLCGKPRVLEKTPLHLLFLPTLHRLLPQARVCHIVRDGRDVAASFLKTFGHTVRFGDPVRYICRMHAEVLAMDQRIRQLNWANYRAISYADFMREPERILGEVLAWFGLSFPDRLRAMLTALRPTSSNWDRLSPSVQGRVDQYLDYYLHARGVAEPTET